MVDKDYATAWGGTYYVGANGHLYLNYSAGCDLAAGDSCPDWDLTAWGRAREIVLRPDAGAGAGTLAAGVLFARSPLSDWNSIDALVAKGYTDTGIDNYVTHHRYDPRMGGYYELQEIVKEIPSATFEDVQGAVNARVRATIPGSLPRDSVEVATTSLRPAAHMGLSLVGAYLSMAAANETQGLESALHTTSAVGFLGGGGLSAVGVLAGSEGLMVAGGMVSSAAGIPALVATDLRVQRASFGARYPNYSAEPVCEGASREPSPSWLQSIYDAVRVGAALGGGGL